MTISASQAGDPAAPLKIALYGEVDANTVEGPAIWLASVARALAARGHQVTILLRNLRHNSAPLAPLDAEPNIRIVDPYALGLAKPGMDRRLSGIQAARLLGKLDAETRFDFLIVRGSVTVGLAARQSYAKRVVAYVTDFPQPPARYGMLRRLIMAGTLRRTRLVLCQTPEIADYLDRHLGLRGRVAMAPLPPIVDDAIFDLPRARRPESGYGLSLVYAGKFAPAWNTLQIAELPRQLGQDGIASTLHMVGDKFLNREDSDFPDRMKRALTLPGVVWHGGLTRLDALRLSGDCHIGMAWRDRRMDGSLELSTKLLDYGAIGLPAICNPTPMHRRLLGADYPLFATTSDDVRQRLKAVLGDAGIWRAAQAAGFALAETHRASRIGAALEGALRGLG